MRHGKGILYDLNGYKTYEGDWLYNKRDGYGLKFINNSSSRIKYEGYWTEDLASGKGTSYFENGKKDYEGQRKDGVAEGYGISYYETSGTIEYEGEWQNGETDGKGILYYDILDEQCTEFKDTMKSDSMKGKKMYEGNWKSGLYNGYGVEWYQTGEIKHSGKWKDGMPTHL